MRTQYYQLKQDHDELRDKKLIYLIVFSPTDQHIKLEEEHREMRTQYYQLKQDHDELRDKMKFFTKESAVDFGEIEEALMIVKSRKEQQSQELDFLQRVDEEKERGTCTV